MTPAPTVPAARTPASLVRLLLAAVMLASATVAVGPASHPAPVAATTASTIEGKLLSLINAERAKHGLVALRKHAKLIDLAGDRAAYMASIGAMQHISCLSCTLNSRNIQWYYAGEVIAWTGYPADQAAQSIFDGWMGSSSHRAILLSSRFNYIGLGVAYRSANRSFYASGVLTESRDQTKPWVRMAAGKRSGTKITWTWSGADTRLQTHTSGLKNFDVQYRQGSGSWTTIRSGTTATALTLTRGTGTYGVRVRSRDNRGYVSAWSSEVRISVP